MSHDPLGAQFDSSLSALRQAYHQVLGGLDRDLTWPCIFWFLNTLVFSRQHLYEKKYEAMFIVNTNVRATLLTPGCPACAGIMLTVALSLSVRGFDSSLMATQPVRYGNPLQRAEYNCEITLRASNTNNEIIILGRELWLHTYTYNNVGCGSSGEKKHRTLGA